MNRLRLCLCLFLFVAPLRAGALTGEPVTRGQVDAAVERGLGWIERHPASVQDGGLPDVLDEAVGFRVLSMATGDATAGKAFADRFSERIVSLGSLPEFTQWVNAWRKQPTDYYHLALAAHLMRQAGQPTELQSAIVAQAQWFLASCQFCDPTKRLTTALFLQRLGEKPAVPVEDLLKAGRIERIARGDPPELPAADADPNRRRAAGLELYALVHEVVSLTDFGRDAPPPWLAGRLEPLHRYLVQAIAWVNAGTNVDLLSELLLTAAFVDTPLQDVLPDALRLLLSRQQSDGSWGASETSTRLNKYRHAVFTATTALRSLGGREAVDDR